MLPTPNAYRTASGAPGIDYWQQRADYKIDVTIDDENQMLYGEEVITYFNNSPDVLRYLWVQLDQNVRANDSNTPLVTPSTMSNSYSGKRLQSLTNSFTNAKGEKYNGGYEISYVKDLNNKNLNYKKKHKINYANLIDKVTLEIEDFVKKNSTNTSAS